MNMYEKRERRKNKKLENNDTEKSCLSVNINWFPGHMAKTKRLIDEKKKLIDIVYEVVDARMPYSSKLRDVDYLLKDKPRIIIMTKMDLCDKRETTKWIEHYQKEGYKVIGLDLENNFNLKPLFNLTKEVLQEKNQKKLDKGLMITRSKVLIVGIPNVGKSTLINRLVGKKVTNVGNKPGVTKSLEWIRINDELELLDTPGILWPNLEQTKISFNLASLTAIKEDILPLDEVVTYILQTLYKYYPHIVKDRYGIEEMDFTDMLPTFDLIGKKRGCLIKGGEVDYDKVINVVMNDIKNNTIKYITFDRYGDYYE